jgi:hypothetical protein
VATTARGQGPRRAGRSRGTGTAGGALLRLARSKVEHPAGHHRGLINVPQVDAYYAYSCYNALNDLASAGTDRSRTVLGASERPAENEDRRAIPTFIGSVCLRSQMSPEPTWLRSTSQSSRTN